jgi:hypothetical protein
MANYGRSVAWFLEEGLTKEDYRKHKHDVERSLQLSTWRSLMAIIIDTRLWPGINDHPMLHERVMRDTEPWNNHTPIHFREIRGRITILWRDDQGRLYLRIILDHDHQSILDCPIEAMISDRSTGFPKVAYNPEQYLLGYRMWLDYLTSTKDALHDEVNAWANGITLTQWFIKENFSMNVYEQIRSLLALKQSFDNPSKVFHEVWHKEIKRLETTMVQEMLQDIPNHNQSMYIHTIEWFMNPRLLQGHHPLTEAYLRLRQTYPRMILGKAFIPVV